MVQGEVQGNIGCPPLYLLKYPKEQGTGRRHVTTVTQLVERGACNGTNPAGLIPAGATHMKIDKLAHNCQCSLNDWFECTHTPKGQINTNTLTSVSQGAEVVAAASP